MDGLPFLLFLSALPAFGNFSGGLIAEAIEVTPRMLNLALHAAAGIVIAVIAVELIPEALEAAPAWLVVLAFLLGGAAYIALESALRRLSSGSGSGAWMIYAAVAIDLFSDGLMIGAGSAVSPSLALVLALGQVTADVPEGFATTATFKGKGFTRRSRLLLSGSFIVASVGGALIGWVLLRGQSETVKFAGLAFVAGLLLIAAVEDMIAEAHETREDSRASTASFVGGFALFTLVASYF